jgi:hypothetical protein
VPNNSIYKCDGFIEDKGKKINICNDNVLLRGMSLKNTSSIVGLVLYSGHDTKI